MFDMIRNALTGSEGTVVMPRVLTYHDVVEADFDTSGFPGGGPAHYKLPRDEFTRHLGAIAATSVSPIL